MRILEVKNNLVKISFNADEHLVLSGFVIIEDENMPYVAQVVNLKADDTGNYAIVKLLFTFNSDGNTDLLLAKSLAVDFGSSATVPLIFSHALHKLEVEYVSDGSVTEEDLDGVETVLTALSSCVVDMKEGIIIGQTVYMDQVMLKFTLLNPMLDEKRIDELIGRISAL